MNQPKFHKQWMNRGNEIMDKLEDCLALIKKDILSFDITDESEGDYAQWSHPGTVWAHVWDLDEMDSETTETGKVLPGARCGDKMSAKDYEFQLSKRMTSGIYHTAV